MFHASHMIFIYSFRGEIIKGMTSNMIIKFVIAIVLSGSFFISPAVMAQPVVPGALGFGIDTPAGRGIKSPAVTTVYRVDTTADSRTLPVRNSDGTYSGSFRACVSHDPKTVDGSRVIIFEISGVIDLSELGDITITRPYMTIAGQTAPSPGITFIKGDINIKAHHVLVQHIRVRNGDDPNAVSKANYRDCLNAQGLKDGSLSEAVVFDHCSLSWGMDENGGVGGVKNVTLRYCIYAEPLLMPIRYDSRKAAHEDHLKGRERGKNLLISRSSGKTFIYGSLFAHAKSRNPLLKGSSRCVFANNVIYNYFVGISLTGKDETWGDPSPSDPAFLSAMGNVFVHGPNSLEKETGVRLYEKYTPLNSKIYLSKNSFNGKTQENDWTEAWSDIISFNPIANSPPLNVANLALIRTNDVLKHVLSYTGARPADRDDVDKRIIQDVKNLTGRHIDSQDEVNGWQQIAKQQNRRALTLPANYNRDDDGDGYTNLEEWLHAFSAAVEGRGAASETSLPEAPKNFRLN
jgi:hypothetical protein